jgi:hypothetical protein
MCAYFDDSKQAMTDANGNLKFVDPLYQLMSYENGLFDLQGMVSSYLTEQGQLDMAINEKYGQAQALKPQDGLNVPESTVTKTGGMTQAGVPNVHMMLGSPRVGMVGPPWTWNPIHPQPFDKSTRGPQRDKMLKMPQLKNFSFKK